MLSFLLIRELFGWFMKSVFKQYINDFHASSLPKNLIEIQIGEEDACLNMDAEVVKF